MRSRRSRILVVIVAAVLALAVLLIVRGCGHHEVAVGHRAVRDGSIPLVDNSDRFYFIGSGWLASNRQLWERVEESLQFRLPRFLLEQGWSSPESWGVWGSGESSTLAVNLAETRDRLLMLECHSVHGPRRRQGQTVEVRFNDTVCGSFTAGRRFAKHYLPIPAAIQQPGINRITLSYSFHASSQSLGHGDDTRDLSVAFRRFELRTGAKRPSIWAQAAELVLGAEDLSPEYDIERNRLVLHSSGSLVTPLYLPPTARSLALAARASGVSGTTSSKLTVRVIQLDGRSRQLPLPAQPVTDQAQRDLLKAELPLADLAGETCLLVLEAELGSARSIEVLSPRLELDRSATPTAEPDPAQPRPGSQPRPDIVLITLDAARADHFSCYGYPRPTTPVIDQLAGKSLVFRNAIALAPYTLCSVPTMVSGLSFLDHGVTLHGQRLGDPADTLAEHLQDAGYRTICFSATPNNSTKLGTDQGYDEFYEVWRGVSGKKARNPWRLSNLVLERLAQTEGSEQPLHLQIHYVPPHEPYDPQPQHDRFGDPEYQGSYDGSLATMKAINQRRLHPGAADIEEIISLYDGNLNRADSAVGLVLRALRQRPRWSETVLLVVSDHAEAMYEHGLIGHNSTVYDDMLRVPFILRLPKSFVPPGPVDTERLVTLADIVPTLLATAGLSPRSQVAGVNLLATDPIDSGRYLIARTANPGAPAYALRSGRWKLVNSHGYLELYDLRADPGEQRNLANQMPMVAAGLAKLLQQQVRAAPEQTLAEMQTEVNSDDLAMLKELGYID